MSDPYRKSTVPFLVNRLRGYADYIGCGCYDKRPEGKCAGESTCARADYVAMVRALKRGLVPRSRRRGGA